jgi:hypothetical protein
VREWEKPIRYMVAENAITVERMIGVYAGDRKYDFDGFRVLPVTDFFQDLFAGNVF